MADFYEVLIIEWQNKPFMNLIKTFYMFMKFFSTEHAWEVEIASDTISKYRRNSLLGRLRNKSR